MHWKNMAFSELTLDELYELLQLRVDVFVVEQNCPYPELDDKDRLTGSRHLMGMNDEGKMMCYARILPPGVSYPDTSIGRVLVEKEARGGGKAFELMQQAIDIAFEHWPTNNIQLGGQAYLVGFYEALGFKTVSDVYLEDNIPHVDMLLEVN
ncbi:GNAT family N-acetyltransferase [Shewanella surugensis]|uniref:GNAT family N-acetyltransferase n=1 Tax=Shewanella surugensis TaxID=212020 RepID=A0ABT0LEC8_9GAMM|nr:GNAT family N-acetyltransferase [Shewanella surugensis]MCL1126059.1 GNAT family N-acetyltransferase [Shewanella surugensis]